FLVFPLFHIWFLCLSSVPISLRFPWVFMSPETKMEEIMTNERRNMDNVRPQMTTKHGMMEK
ncbi:MAG TPA: hypothetical protein VHT72_05405, partial [Puia sp.]|nr:hypothetical protein [Puia sp.]